MPKSSIAPSSELKKLQDGLSKYSAVVGIDFFDPHPKPNFLTLLTTVVSIFWQCLVWHTIVKKLPSLDVLTIAFVHVSFFSQGLMRTVNLKMHPLTTTILQASMLDFFKHHENNNNDRAILEQAIKRMKKLAYGIIIFDCFIFNSGIVLLMVLVLTGAYILFVPIYLPFLNAQELVGYLLNLSLQLALGAIGFFTFATYDATVLICGYHSLTMVEMLKMRMRKLQQEMDFAVKEKKFDDENKFAEKFIKIIQFHEDIKIYDAEFSNLVRVPFATALFVNLIGISFCINMALKRSLFLGIGASLGLFVQLLLPFIVAIMQSHQKDRVCYEAVTFSWDSFQKRSDQRNYQHFLNILRNHRGISLPIVRALNMKLFFNILAVAYFVVINIKSIIWWCEN